ncbi:MAG: PaaI family thioesterase [Planctomycetota bacterium]|nr:MAG: PaaI family thioesterase [Planctomycetota bacterium]
MTSRTKLPNHGECFVCGKQSGSGLNIAFFCDENRQISATAVLQKRHQGPPEHAHGGVLFAMLDEAMGASAWANGYQVLAAHLEIDFKKPVPLGEEISLNAAVVQKEGRKVFTEGKIVLKSGEVAALAKGLFVECKDFFQTL